MKLALVLCKLKENTDILSIIKLASVEIVPELTFYPRYKAGTL